MSAERNPPETEEGDWRHRAECLSEDPELFFPVGAETGSPSGPAKQQIEEAKAVCERCDVKERCLSWALEIGIEHGVFGGMTGYERRALIRRNARLRARVK